MNLYKKIQQIKAQIIDTEKLLEMVIDHPIMSISYKGKLDELKAELAGLSQESFEPKVDLLFSGNAVIGSHGIKSDFVSRVLKPFQDMIKSQTALVRFGQLGRRGQTKKNANTDLYLTALPLGSFGVELSQLEQNDLIDSIDVSNSIKQIMALINNLATNNDTEFENTIENTSIKNLTNVKQFLKEISDENSFLKMESNELVVELSETSVHKAYSRVAATITNEDEEYILGIFRGILLNSRKFEAQDKDGRNISGYISDLLDEDVTINYDYQFLNKECTLHLKKNIIKFATGRGKTEYELLEIKAL